MNRAGWKTILRTLWQTSMVGAWTLVTAQAATVRIDTSRAPALKAWADSTETIAREWYPRLGNLLATTHDLPLPSVAIRVNPDFKGIAAVSWSSIEISANWISQHPGDSRGAVIHELVHVVQAYCHRAVENQPQRGGSNPASLRCLFDRVFEVEGQESVGGWIAG